jgi:hypothetical protein
MIHSLSCFLWLGKKSFVVSFVFYRKCNVIEFVRNRSIAATRVSVPVFGMDDHYNSASSSCDGGIRHKEDPNENTTRIMEVAFPVSIIPSPRFA